jgi:hypothetical protein
VSQNPIAIFFFGFSEAMGAQMFTSVLGGFRQADVAPMLFRLKLVCSSHMALEPFTVTL